MIIDQLANRVDQNKKVGPDGPTNGGFTRLLGLIGARKQEYLKVTPTGIKGVPGARYSPTGGETVVPEGPPYTSVQLPYASSYKIGASKFEVGPPDSNDYCISAIDEVKKECSQMNSS